MGYTLSTPPTERTSVREGLEDKEPHLFPANYPGRCPDCDDEIEIGDEVGFRSGTDGVLCSDCLLSNPARINYTLPDKKPCGECWLIHEGDCP
jgi:hypothetical protein